MLICSACQGQFQDRARFCPHCGRQQDDLTAPGPSEPAGLEPRPASPLPLSSSGALTPGATLASRYRIISLLGRGGMGEVYRADDLVLGQAVALKFLPITLDRDPGRLQRFLQEVRLSREVSHPNVCRVYDVGESGGRHFLSMEFVDGEDLSSLLRRIGRLPSDKAVEIARQLCAGLAAAHEQGVLHRDLKPANVMLDGRGKVRLTDFGLAQPAAGGAESELAGTPAYMAPEQLEGRPASVKSDLYALGLVIAEVFTGKRVFDAVTIDGLRNQHREGAARSLTSTVRDIDPAVERIVQRCLETEPARRPASALAVAAALPGGDPLAAALAAGETPSPELVAAAGPAEGMRPALAFAAVAIVVASIGAISVLSWHTNIFRRVSLDRPPAVLVDRAREIIQRFGYTDPPYDSTWFVTFDGFYLPYVAQRDQSARRWDALESMPVVFLIYRQSPRALVPYTFSSRVAWSQPPDDVSGMANCVVDRKGRLVVFAATPPHYVGQDPPSVDVDWAAAFAEARLDMAAFKAVPPKWVPPMACDRRVAWEGNYPSTPPIPVHIEAASFQGKPVYFNIRGPWDVPYRQTILRPTLGEHVAQGLASALLLLVVASAVLLARRHWRAGRGDPTGAARLAAFVFVVLTASWVASAHHADRVQDEVGLVVLATSLHTFIAATSWAVYMALEPYVRRRWPHMLISWTRVLAGRIRDPLVGRDVLIGAAAGSIIALLQYMEVMLPVWAGQPPGAPGGNILYVGDVIGALGRSVFVTLGVLFVILIIRLVVRRDGLAIGLAFVWLTLLSGGIFSLWTLVPAVLSAAVSLTVLFRVGLLALTVSVLSVQLLVAFPISLDWTVWHAPVTFSALGAVVALTAFGLHTALRGQSVFGRLLED
jgi:serine/threonine-protein kinase